MILGLGAIDICFTVPFVMILWHLYYLTKVWFWRQLTLSLKASLKTFLGEGADEIWKK